MHIEITTRHGGLGPEQQAYLHDKAQKLLKYFGRLMQIEVEVEHLKHSWQVEILVSAEHKHDFVARESNGEVLVALDHALTKIEGQLRRYKEKIQDHRRDPSAGEIAAASEPRGPTEE